MNKQEFLNQLEKKLDRINETERKDILMEYGTYIDDKMATGVSEEDAVSGFGDVDELAEEILDAYKIIMCKQRLIRHWTKFMFVQKVY